MPITRYPVVHKFGIISHSQRIELQERLLKQTYLKSLETKSPHSQPKRNPLEITESFPNVFNSSKTPEDTAKLEEQAFKMLERIKRRAGLKEGGNADYVDLPVAWTEVAQLSQCRGKVQEECFNVLISSLEQAPLKVDNIIALFFLAETSLYWLRTDMMGQPYLRTTEIKLLKVSFLVFMRLFYHHMSGNMTGHNHFKNRLFQYLDGLADCQDAYNPYPNALLYLRFVNEVGKIIVADATLDTNDDLGLEEDFYDIKQARKKSARRTPVAASAAVSTSVHDLSPTLWHALDVWRCTNGLGGGIEEALKGLAHCAVGLASENWIDACTAMVVLTEAAKSNLAALRVMQNLARGLVPQETSLITTPNIGPPLLTMDAISTGNSLSEPVVDGKLSLSDIAEKNEDEAGSSGKAVMYDKNLSRAQEDLSAIQISSEDNIDEAEKEDELKRDVDRADSPEGEQPIPSPRRSRSKPDSRRKVTRESQRSKLSSEMETVNTGWRVDGDDTRGLTSQASIMTYGNEPSSECKGLNSWRWEVAFFYVEALTEICLKGSTSVIQKIALVGKNKSTDMLYKHAPGRTSVESAGLLDLVYFHASKEKDDGGPNDWSWRIRYAAIHNLVKICQCLSSDKNREGLRSVAWNTLLKVHSTEADCRVLEGFKVGQVDASIQEMMSKYCSVPLPITSSSLGAKVASGLVTAYLPPLPPVVTSRKPSPSPRAKILINHPVNKSPQRTSLKQEIMLATSLQEPQPDFNARTSFDLKRIVEDQWRKDLEVQMEKEEHEKVRDIKIKTKEEEIQQEQIEEGRKKKLGTRYQPNSAYSLPGGDR